MGGVSAADEIDAIVASFTDWRGPRLAELRAVIREADQDIVEEVKWKKPSRPAGVPVWSHDGIVCIGEALKKAVRLTFPKGARLDDSTGLFTRGWTALPYARSTSLSQTGWTSGH